MKKLLLFVFVFILYSCNLDKRDNENINLIEKVWKQWLDNAIDVYETKQKKAR